MCWSLLFNKLQARDLQLYKKETPAWVFSCEFCEIFRVTFFIETLRATASSVYQSEFVLS